MSEKTAEDFIEIRLGTDGVEPRVLGHASSNRSGRVRESEAPIAAGRAVRDVTENDVLTFVVGALTPLL
jgi:hypothetical protein